MKGWTRAEAILKAITWDMFGLRLCIFAHFIIFLFPHQKTCREDGFSSACSFPIDRVHGKLDVKRRAYDACVCVCVCCSEKGVDDEEDLYDCVYDDEDGGEIYEDLMKTEATAPPVSPQLNALLLTGGRLSQFECHTHTNTHT